MEEDSDDDSVAHDDDSIFDGDDDYLSQEISQDAISQSDEDETDWNLQFENHAEEFEPNVHVVNSELHISEDTSSLEIFQHFITSDIVQEICTESARYAQQKNMANFKPFDAAEFWRFLAVHFTMGIVKKASIKEYWSTNSIVYTPFFSSALARDRYIQILHSLHFYNNDAIPQNNEDKFVKLGTFLTRLVENWKSAVHVGEYLCLDESLVPFKGRLSIKQYNPKKRSRFGVKLFVLADCSSKLILDVLPYQGATTKLRERALVQTMGFGGAAVITMLYPYLGLRQRVIVDNYFNSPTLARYLHDRGTYLLGTVQKRRVGMPKENNMTRKLKKNEVVTFSDGKLLVERWLDRREVCMLNTFLPHEMIEVETANPRNCRAKPATVLLYNSKMGIVDDSDKMISPHASIRKTRKWYRKVAFHLIDISVYNALLLYNIYRHRKLSYANFLKDLVEEILKKYPKPFIARGRPAMKPREFRLDGKNHFPVLGPVVVSSSKISRGNCTYCTLVHGKRKQVRYICSNENCAKRLCVDGNPSCFQLYHTEANLKRKRVLTEVNTGAGLESSTGQEARSSNSEMNSLNIFENSQDFVL